jgi:hypothetical protein
MKKFLSVLLGIVLLFPLLLSAEVAREQADSIALEYIQSEVTWEHVLLRNDNPPSENGSTSVAWTNSALHPESLSVEYSCWAYCIDAPNVNVPHAILFLFVNREDGSLLEVKSRQAAGASLEGWTEVAKKTASGKMLTDSKVWRMDGGYACPQSDSCFCRSGIKTIKMDGTAILNNVEYAKATSSWSFAPDVWKTEAYIREAPDGKVYFYAEKCGKEFLLYDFDLQVGDSVILMDYFISECSLNEQGETTQGASYVYAVTEVDSAAYNQVKRKYLKLRGERKLFWIEGVGDITGLLYPSAARSGVSQLKDCYVGDDLLFLNDNPEYCFINAEEYQTANVSSINYGALRVFADRQNILHISNAKNTSLSIYDMQGRMLQAIHPNSDSYEADVSTLPSGVYIIGSKNTYVKFLKQ